VAATPLIAAAAPAASSRHWQKEYDGTSLKATMLAMVIAHLVPCYHVQTWAGLALQEHMRRN